MIQKETFICHIPEKVGFTMPLSAILFAVFLIHMEHFTSFQTFSFSTHQCPGKPVKQALPGYTRQDKNQLPLSRGEC